MKSSSSTKNVGILGKIRYCYKLFRIRTLHSNANLIPWGDFALYENILRKHGGSNLASSAVLEVGYGARPWRLITLISMGINARGIDLDQPAVGFSLRRLLVALRKNGLERFLKSAFRSFFFDSKDLVQLKNELHDKGFEFRFDLQRFQVGDAANVGIFSESEFDFCFSEDVFEHIPEDSLASIVKNLHTWLKPRGIAFIRPHIFSGISGGHDPDFYPHRILDKSIDPNLAWSHLVDEKFTVNTYLNRLRLEQYKTLFLPYFEILETVERIKDLGKEYLTREVQDVLQRYTQEELLTNQIGFILKSRKRV
jgi:hypothetical protein